MTKNVIEIKNLEKYFEVNAGFLNRKKSIVKAVDNISFNIPIGESLGLVGQSGCGKTTTARTLCLLDQKTGGEVNYYNTETKEMDNIDNLNDEELKKFRRNIQMIFQDPYESLNPRWTIKDIILEPLNIHNIGSLGDREEAVKADLVTLEDEIKLFKSINMGITLSIAHCEGNDLCTLPMEEKEVQQLVKTLEFRIDSLAARQSEINDIIGFNKVLSAYINERDNYSMHIERIRSLIISFGSRRNLPQLGDDPDFPVETAINEELLGYLNELSLFEDEELKDDEDLSGAENLPNIEEINKLP